MGKIVINTGLNELPDCCFVCKYRILSDYDRMPLVFKCSVLDKQLDSNYSKERDLGCPLQKATDFISENFDEIWER